MSSDGRIPDGVRIPKGRLLAAFSGGSDSLFLLSVLSKLAPERTEALYINHGIRSEEEIDREIRLNKDNAASLSIPFHALSLDKARMEALSRSLGTEAAARQLRYEALKGFAIENGFDWILTAHHREDQAETVLMRILSSSPFYAYQGIREEDGMIFRPILSVPKKEILSYLKREGLAWSEDSTNSDARYLRNSIRESILPLLGEDARESLSRIAENVSALRRRYQPIAFEKSAFISFYRDEYLSSFGFQKEELIYSVFHAFGSRERVSRESVEAITAKVESGKGRLSVGSVVFFFSPERIKAYRAIRSFALPFDESGVSFDGFRLSPASPDEKTLIINTDLLKGHAIIRDSREGDRITLKGGEKLVSDLEREMHIPYSIVLEDQSGIKAVFARFLGGSDRLSRSLLSKEREGVALAIALDCSYIQGNESNGR